MRAGGTLPAVAAAVFALSACEMGGSTGYLELRTVPGGVRGPALYIDADRIDAKPGTTVLRQAVGTARLQTDGADGKVVLLCQVVVKKNRITTVTISALERPPRCQCERTGNDSKACIG